MYMYRYIKINMIVSILTTQINGVIAVGSPSKYFYQNTYVYSIQFQIYVHACKCVGTMHLNSSSDENDKCARLYFNSYHVVSDFQTVV